MVHFKRCKATKWKDTITGVTQKTPWAKFGVKLVLQRNSTWIL